MLGGPLGQGLGVVKAGGTVNGVLNATDVPDLALFLQTNLISGVLNATDAPDTALFNGELSYSGILAAIEPRDTALFNGIAVWPPITGILKASEQPDVALFVEERLSNRVPSPVAQSPWDCLRNTPPRRRVFWTTQPEACGSFILCGQQCQIPGLVYEEGADDGRTIVTTDWLQSLILNILNTRARSDLKCPTPMATYGHWSESYREDGLYIGAQFWNAAEKSYIRVADGVKMIGTMVKSDLSKLVQMGVAANVEVDAVYGGNNQVVVTIRATSPMTGNMVINLTGAFVASGWEWR